jgi:uncharacterized membrane protein
VSLFVKYLIVMVTSMFPIIELKGAIPIGVASGAVKVLGMNLNLGLHLPYLPTFFVALVGSCLPVPFILIFLRPIYAWMKKKGPFKKFADFLQRKADKNNGVVKKYELLGLFIFVAIPLPTTGVWTGALIATLLDLDFKKSLIAIVLGNVVAGLIILTVSYGFGKIL